jgi:hypothetical protein
VDAVELPRDDQAGGSMMKPAWPERIFFGHAGASREMARKSAFPNMTRANFLASGHTDNKGAKRGWKL